MSYDVKFSEVEDLSNDYATYRSKLGEAAESLSGRVEDLVGLDGFQGEAATRIKAYFSEAHLALLASLDTLAAQLATEYAERYHSRLKESPVGETDTNARWPQEAMQSAQDAIKALREGDLASAQSELDQARGWIPAEFGFSIPSTQAVSQLMQEEEGAIDSVRQGVADAEASGKAAFTGDSSDFSSLSSSLHAAIALCATSGYSIGGYQSGAFKTIIETSGLREAYERCASYQATNAQLTIDCQQSAIEGEQLRVEEAAKKAAEEKQIWACVGLVASLVVVIGSAMATVATFGTAAPLVAMNALGVVAAIADMSSRGAQLGSMLSGDLGADADSESELSKKLRESGKAAAKSNYNLGAAGDKAKLGMHYDGRADYYYSQGNLTDGDYLYNKASGLFEKADDYITKAGVVGGKFLVDQVADIGIDQIEDEGVKVGAKTVKNIADGAVDYVIGTVGKRAGGVVSTIGKCGTVVADYFVDKADAAYEECQSRYNKLDSLKEDLRAGSNLSYAW